jgi:hypothetical protein
MIEALEKILFLKSGKMPAMPRSNKRATKVAFKILGTPANLEFKRSKQQEYVNKMLISQETSRVK